MASTFYVDIGTTAVNIAATDAVKVAANADAADDVDGSLTTGTTYQGQVLGAENALLVEGGTAAPAAGWKVVPVHGHFRFNPDGDPVWARTTRGTARLSITEEA